MSPRTRLILPLAGLALLSACGEPPAAPLKSPPIVTASAAPISIDPSLPVGLPTQAPPTTVPTTPPIIPPTLAATLPTVGAYPTYAPPTTLPAETVSPTVTPSHAPKCTGSPTASQILALVKDAPGVPRKPLKVDDGPFCSGDWSFTTVEVSGESEDQLEPLMVVATGKDSTLARVAAGSEVCLSRVQTEAPPGIRVLACGF